MPFALYPKGALAPPFLPVCSPGLRDDALLSRAVDAFQTGYHADALLMVEYVCRRYPSKSIPAILRAKIVQACRPELTAKAWYRAWHCDPENPMLQDAMLQAWLESGAAVSVAELGPVFLTARCRIGQHGALLALLRRVNVTQVGACWKSGPFIEGMLFSPLAGNQASRCMRVTVSDERSEFHYDVPADGRRFRIACPRPEGVWSVTFAQDTTTAAVQLLHGSPLVFQATHQVQAGILPASAKGHAPQALQGRNPVSIIIPVYREFALVKACIDSVLCSLPLNTTRAELVVIDDASPEPALSAWLDALAATGSITLLRNRYNLGFIETTNRGLRHHPGHDALLLNADTLVQGDWIDRLGGALYSAPDIASVTPWSNNGEISSFPLIATSAPAPAAADLAQIDGLAAALHHSGKTADVELIACCGFAMLMRRSVLKQIGLLDGVGLIRGYGEEVDWCLRAGAAGYRHLAATGVFVGHTGTVSFRFEKTLRVRQNSAVLAARYPHYYSEYRRFIKDDPLGAARESLQVALTDAGSDWLARTVNLIEGRTDFARPLPATLPTTCTRIAVWQHRLSGPGAGKILRLARLIASRQPSALQLRLLIIGEANEALWHTGVVDVLPSTLRQESTVLTDAALVGLSGCVALLTEGQQSAPTGIVHIRIDDEFDPRVWLDAWRSQNEQEQGPQYPVARNPAQSPSQQTLAA